MSVHIHKLKMTQRAQGHQEGQGHFKVQGHQKNQGHHTVPGPRKVQGHQGVQGQQNTQGQVTIQGQNKVFQNTAIARERTAATDTGVMWEFKHYLQQNSLLYHQLLVLAWQQVAHGLECNMWTPHL